ncbi:hypothetical protein [Microbacterium sp. AG790]|uniref:hypothetical protein n=1 Tax=Microbacterium sp. AG790 TaxID=2183995 RepID=UPI0015FF114B|nr:hypothetical protein [Microbacterium sp. AG790]
MLARGSPIHSSAIRLLAREDRSPQRREQPRGDIQAHPLTGIAADNGDDYVVRLDKGDHGKNATRVITVTPLEQPDHDIVSGGARAGIDGPPTPLACRFHRPRPQLRNGHCL